jgi:aminoglycoside phosphotransferase (APT) family kinase protein
MSETLTRREPQQIIDDVRPEHGTIEWLYGGDNRHVAVVDGEAFRFPKDDGGIEVGRYEYEALELLQGKLSIGIPRPIELAPDGSYNVLSFLPGKVLSKQAVSELPFDKRHALGVAIGTVMNELNAKLSRDEIAKLSMTRPLARNSDDYYAATYETALIQDSRFAAVYRENYERLQLLRPQGSNSNIVVFGDFSPPNLVLSDDNRLVGVIDWTDLGFGDIHNELRPVFSAIGQPAFEGIIQTVEANLGPIDRNLVRLGAVVHELAVLVGGKQKGELTPPRTKLATDLLDQWLDKDWKD